MNNIIVVKEAPTEIDEFFELPPLRQRMLFFNRTISRTWSVSDILKRDGNIYFSISQKEMKVGRNGIYSKVTKKDGFTFDGEKIKVWFGKNWNPVDYTDHFIALGYNWITPHNVFGFITKSVAEKILSGSITNPKDILKQYLKNSRIKASPKLLYDYVVLGGSKMQFLSDISVVKNIDNYLKHSIKNNCCGIHYSLQDIIQQAKILNEKIDFGWSKKRLMLEHNKMTKRLMFEELEYIGDKRATYDDKVMGFISTLPKKNFRLLESEKELFVEGSTMKHCVYTNYKNDVLSSKYIVFHVTYNNEDLTLGCRVGDDNVVVYSQLYGVGNKQPSKGAKSFVEKYFKIKELETVYFDRDVENDFDVDIDYDLDLEVAEIF